jgi:hypothetical protein
LRKYSYQNCVEPDCCGLETLAEEKKKLSQDTYEFMTVY